MTTVLGVIPARGGSKGVPRKNIYPLAGIPLIGYTIRAAKGSKTLSEFIVSTEDAEISEVARSLGAGVPFVRPAHLATDEALAVPTIQHAVKEMETLRGKSFDYVMMLQPTCPFLLSTDIDQAVEKILLTKADSIISVSDVGSFHPFRMRKIENDRLVSILPEPVENLPRQKLPKIYIRSGAIYLVKREVLMIQNSFTGQDCRPVIIPPERGINIDSKEDLLLAEYKLIGKFP